MAHYDFYATKKVSGIGALVNKIATRKLAGLCARYCKFSAAKTNPSILEIGPGKGKFGDELRAIAPIDYKAFEADGILFAELASRGVNVVNAMVPPIAEENSSFDCVALINVLEHMPHAAAAEALIQEIARVLKPNGTLFLVVPNFLDWKKDFFNLDYTHQFITTEVRCRQILADAGYRVTFLGYHYGCFFNGIGRPFNQLVRFLRAVISALLPRSISRRDTIQKLGVLFAENIICMAQKPESRAGA